MAEKIEPGQFQRVLCSLEEVMALVPEGAALLQRANHRPLDPANESFPPEPLAGWSTSTVSFAIVTPMTNEQYFDFVIAGGYQDPTLWDPMILPAV